MVQLKKVHQVNNCPQCDWEQLPHLEHPPAHHHNPLKRSAADSAGDARWVSASLGIEERIGSSSILDADKVAANTKVVCASGKVTVIEAILSGL